MTVTLFNSYNASTTIGTTQTKFVSGMPSTSVPFGFRFSNVLTMITNDTIQLGGALTSTTAAQAITSISCDVIVLLN